MIDTQQILEFDKIKDKLKDYACTKNAKETIDDLKPYMSEVELRGRLRETGEARLLLEKAGNPPMSALNNIDELLMTAGIGGCLTGDQLEDIALVLSSVKRLKDYLVNCKCYDIGLPYYEENLDPMESVRKEIDNNIHDGNVIDSASKLLKNLRNSIRLTKDKMHEKADSVMRNNKSSMSDSFSTIRNGHICIPVKKDCKSKIDGTVVSKSSTGGTLFVEPAAVGRYYDELVNLKLDEENEERRILYMLTGMLADASPIMQQNKTTIEKLDFMFAKARFSLDYDCVCPDINTDRRIKIVDGRHPLMDKMVNVPLQFELGDGTNGIIITGPNTGGKTVAIKTVAINCMMAQCGLHVVCGKADICMNDHYLCDIGDGQNLSENLSTFSAHITNVLDILKMADRDSLVIMDELGSGTDPLEGMGIAIAVLEELKKSGALYLVTTHYPEVKKYAELEDGVMNARMTFDKDSLKPLYQLVIGEAGESCAFHIAGRLGMPSYMLKRAAKAAYGAKTEDEDSNALIPTVSDDFVHERGIVNTNKIKKKKKPAGQQTRAKTFSLGDSVMVYPDKKIGIVCKTADDKGIIRVQLPEKKIYINHKRVKMVVAASQLYPSDYDFSIIFDSVDNRKLRHNMDRKYVEGACIELEE